MHKSAFVLALSQVYPAARLNRCFDHSSVDALIDSVVRCQLPHQILVWLDSGTLTHLRITVAPQLWPAYCGYAWWPRLHPDVTVPASVGTQ